MQGHPQGKAGGITTYVLVRQKSKYYQVLQKIPKNDYCHSILVSTSTKTPRNNQTDTHFGEN
jgi:hypothetical protein